MAFQLYVTPTNNENKEHIRETRYTSNSAVITDSVKMMMTLDIVRDLALKAMTQNPSLSYEESFKIAKRNFLGEEEQENVLEEHLEEMQDDFEVTLPPIIDNKDDVDTPIVEEEIEIPQINFEVENFDNNALFNNFIDDNSLSLPEGFEKEDPSSIIENINSNETEEDLIIENDESLKFEDLLIEPIDLIANEELLIKNNEEIIEESENDLLSDLPIIESDLLSELPSGDQIVLNETDKKLDNIEKKDLLFDLPVIETDLLSDLPELSESLDFELPDSIEALEELKQDLEDTLSKTLSGELQMGFKEEPIIQKSRK